MIASEMYDKTKVQNDLQEAADKVEEMDSYGAQRLRELALAVGGGQYSDAWAANDIYQILAVDDIVKRYQTQTALDVPLAIIELFRNILIFVPLVITWNGISNAMTAYNALVQADSQQAQLPFILLWQNGFGHRLPEPLYFGSIASADVWVLFFVIALTFLASFLSGLARMKRESEARKLVQAITHSLAGARLCLTTKNWQQPTNFVTRFDQAIVSFEKVVKELVHEIKDERTAISKLASRQSDETRLFQQFRSDFTSNMDKMAQAINDLQDSTNKLSDTISLRLTRTVDSVQTTMNTLVGPAQELAEHQKEMLAETKKTVTLYSTQIQSQDEIVRQQEQWGNDLRRILSSLEKTVTENANQGNDFADRVRNIHTQYLAYLEEMKKEYLTQKEITNRIFDITLQMEKTVTLISDSSNELSAINVNLDQIVRRVAGLAVGQPVNKSAF